ncbi:MAG: hypothetical protein HOP13_01085 [Alphaproteobacteria bacterium]|nr:hypothetical protein [Alphaproteobacteria bacterium]
MENKIVSPVTTDDLRSGEVYFSISYLDESLLIPTMETFVFLGRDLFREGGNHLFFQRAESYAAGRPRAREKDRPNQLLEAKPDELSNMFDLAGAVDALARCDERRRLCADRSADSGNMQ